MIKEFRGKYYFLSNFYDYPVTYQGITYLNNEAAFQAQKTLNENIKKSFCGLDPSQAKRKGRRIQLRADWEDVKDNIMYEIVLSKFSQDTKLKRMLLDTNDEYLEKGNWWHDNHYGNCICSKCKNIKGENVLGKILMRVREELK